MPSFKLFNRGAGTRSTASPAADQQDAPASQAAAPPPPEGIPFDALTDEWRLRGVMRVEGRLSDALNRRERIAIGDVSWAPADGSRPFTVAPGLQAVDPYDLVVVLGGAESLPHQSDAERSAHRIHKVAYDVALDCPPFRVVGTVHLHPGTDPARLLDRVTGLFIPVTGAETFLEGRRIGEARVEVALVNKSYLRGVEQLDGGSGTLANRPARTAAADGAGVSSAG